ncbi:unnamed protein product [Boreogadus saida]
MKEGSLSFSCAPRKWRSPQVSEWRDTESPSAPSVHSYCYTLILGLPLVFSVVGLNKTKTRNSLALDGTLSSIMTIKMADLEPCFKWEPPSDVLKASKKDTGQYNRAHRS